jgi:outer membrane protein assembly factor BamD
MGSLIAMYATTRWLTVFALAALSLGGCRSGNPYQGMSDGDMYRLGLQKYEEGEWDDAIQTLDRLLASFATSELLPASRLLLAHARFSKGDFLTARSDYQRFLDRYPGHEEAPVAALGVCRSLSELSPVPQRDQAYTNDALAICRNVVVDFAGTPQALEAAELAAGMRLKLAEKEYLVADHYFRRKLFDSAIMYYEFVVRLYPDTEWAPMSLLGIYRSNMEIGYDDLAEDAREQILERYPDSPAASVVRTNVTGS